MTNAKNKALPLAGIRVLDFTWGGAVRSPRKGDGGFRREVVKIETNTHYDFPRTMGPYAGSIKASIEAATSPIATRRRTASRSTSKEGGAGGRPQTGGDLPTSPSTASRAGVLEAGAGLPGARRAAPDIIYVNMPLQGNQRAAGELQRRWPHTLNVLAGIYGLTGYDGSTLVGPGTNYPDHSRQSGPCAGCHHVP